MIEKIKKLNPFKYSRKSEHATPEAETTAREARKLNITQRRDISKYWSARIRLACECPDNTKIERVADAGSRQGDIQILHNGIKIARHSYHGPHMERLLIKNKGVHEPQEEVIFQEVIKHVHAGSTMLELGCYWAFYSIWFQKSVKNAVNFMVEPEIGSLFAGKTNFYLNGCEGQFINGYIASKTIPKAFDIPTYCVDDLMIKNNIKNLSILHSDIQGAEYEMLLGADQSINARMIDFIFISTHSDHLHSVCIKHLLEKQYDIVAEHTLEESYSWDGLIVAKRKEIIDLSAITISKRKI